MKKVLILTVTAGNAHNACAKEMKERLEKKPDVEVKVIDLLKTYSTKLNVWVADKGYGFAVSKLLPLYDAFFNHFKKAKPENRYSCATQNIVNSMLSGLLKLILEFKPDVIYCTHFYGAIALTNLRIVYDIPCKVIVTALDYEMSPFWEAGIGVDYFAIPSEDFVEECISEGFRREQLLPVGLPVSGKTLISIDKNEARKKLGLDESLFTIVVMFGGGYWSGGFKIFKDLIAALQGREVQVVMINGRDKKSFEKIEKMEVDEGIKVVNVGFTNEVPLYLASADMILNKCGGACATEMINMHLPMLITTKIPAQEKYNLSFLVEKGVALPFSNAKQLREGLLKIMDDKTFRNKMVENSKPLKKDAISALENLILEQPNADYTALEKTVNLDDTNKLVRKALHEADRESKKQAKLKNKEN